MLNAGTCHICKKGSKHSIINTGNEDLVLCQDFGLHKCKKFN
ncbi:hypothetical protein CLOSPI_01466 [Thomasclavelia spiroformis DSM 1552]|uniref:Uncharacterized protein n=1 Tax=Thomasclavelia spiroformis DSM 1552 TaxID=428126 RepID=B1C2K4_9FIRM|nr:hypothetical protein CLOSPI_01466 [Thomasclavelia spiroformis DSM 1552]